MAGYSGTPLPKKLGIKARHRVGTVNAPRGFADTLRPLEEGVRITEAKGAGPFDVIVVFVTSERQLSRDLTSAKQKLSTSGGLWIGWPKKSAGVATDVTEGVVRQRGLAVGLVDNKVCAIDEVWSGLRFVYRLADRPKTAAPSKKKLEPAPLKARRRSSAPSRSRS